MFTPEERAAVGKYAAENGNAKASRKYGKAQFDCSSLSTYLAALKAKVKTGVEEDVEAIPTGRRGRPLLLGELDKDAQK